MVRAGTLEGKECPVIVSLNLPEDLVAFIDRQATVKKLSRSAFVAGLLANIRLVESPAGQKALAQSLVSVMAQGALRSGQPLERVRTLFPDFERPLALDQGTNTPPPPQLPAVSCAGSPSPPALESAPVTRRRPYQRAG